MATKIQLRRDTSANWDTINPVLSQGEPGLEVDTGKIKYGDGVTAWLSLAYSGGDAYKPATHTATGRAVGIREVSGVKSFTFKTIGHRFVHITAGQTYDGANTIVVPATDPAAEYLLESYNGGDQSSTKLYVNGDSVISSPNSYNYIVTFDGTNYTIQYNDITFSANVGDQILLTPWVSGTQAIFPDYLSSSDHPAINNSANTNVVRVSLSSDTSLNRNGVTVNGPNQLTAFPGKSYVVINQYTPSVGSNRGGNDTRKIVSATDLGSNVWDLTLDGPARTIANALFTSANVHISANVVSNYYIPVQLSDLPNLAYYNPGADGGGYIEINGTPAANLSSQGYAYSESGCYGVDYNGNWVIRLDQPVTANVTDNVVFHFTQTDSVRVDYYVPNMRDSSSNYSNNAYEWFNWNNDLPFSVAERGNGVRGGRIKGYVTVYRPLDNSSDDTMFNLDFTTGNGYTWERPWTAIDSTDQIPYLKTDYTLNSGGEFGGNRPGGNGGDYIVWDFYESGIFFSETPWADGYNYIAQDIKVDIVYKMEIVVSGRNDDWC
jgi:hypothetical protein